MRLLKNYSAIRFLIGGGANTLLSLMCYWGLSALGISAQIAYSIAYITTFFTSFAINTYFVFRTSWSWKRLGLFPMVHVVVYVCGLLVVTICQRYGVPNFWIPIIALVATLPINFLLTRILMRSRSI